MRDQSAGRATLTEVYNFPFLLNRRLSGFIFDFVSINFESDTSPTLQGPARALLSAPPREIEVQSFSPTRQVPTVFD